MKRFSLCLGVVVVAGLVVFSTTTVVEAKGNPRFNVHECVYSAHGSAAERARNAKPPGTPGGGPGGGGGGGETDCSKTFAQWKGVSMINVFINTANAGHGNPISPADFVNYVVLAFDEWACYSGIGESIAINYVGTAGAADIIIRWRDLGGNGILGQAATGTRGKRILFSTISMNRDQSAFDWTLGPTPAIDADGCAMQEDNGGVAPGKYDFLSVMLHEIGHAFGIAHPTNSCNPGGPCYPETMNACTGAEEYMRRTTNAGDQASIEKLYGLDGP